MARRDLILLGLLVAVIVALAALVGGADRGGGEGDPRASTYLSGEDGAAALFWTLQALELPVARRGEGLVFASPPRGSLALLAPTTDLSPAEASVVMGRVRAGGLLVFAASPWDVRGGPLYDSLGLAVRWTRGASETADGAVAVPAGSHPWMADIDSVRGFRSLFADSSAALDLMPTRTLLRSGDGAAAVLLEVGEGHVLALADVHPLANGRLRSSGAATLVARAAAQAGDTLFFDEFHHGFPDDVGAEGIFRRIGAVLPGMAWFQLFLAAALALYAAGRRFGAPHPPPAALRRSPLEHVEALAGAYRQAGARRTARRLLVAGLARRLGRRAPPDERAAAGMLDRLARGSPASAERAAAVQTEWKRGEAADLAALARQIDRLLDEVRR